MALERVAWVAAALFGLVALVQSVRLALLRGAPRRRLARARARARRGERAALSLLERAGYRIESVQPPLPFTILCDGEPRTFDLRADALVSRAGQRFVVEIKTGDVATRLETPETRRQLLEYSLAYGTDGALLVDMEGERIHEVRFPGGEPRRSLLPLVTVALALLALAWALLRGLR